MITINMIIEFILFVFAVGYAFKSYSLNYKLKQCELRNKNDRQRIECLYELIDEYLSRG